MPLVENQAPDGVKSPSGMALSRRTVRGVTLGAPKYVMFHTVPAKFNDKNSYRDY